MPDLTREEGSDTPIALSAVKTFIDLLDGPHSEEFCSHILTRTDAVNILVDQIPSEQLGVYALRALHCLLKPRAGPQALLNSQYAKLLNALYAFLQSPRVSGIIACLKILRELFLMNPYNLNSSQPVILAAFHALTIAKRPLHISKCIRTMTQILTGHNDQAELVLKLREDERLQEDLRTVRTTFYARDDSDEYTQQKAEFDRAYNHFCDLFSLDTSNHQ